MNFESFSRHHSWLNSIHTSRQWCGSPWYGCCLCKCGMVKVEFEEIYVSLHRYGIHWSSMPQALKYSSRLMVRIPAVSVLSPCQAGVLDCEGPARIVWVWQRHLLESQRPNRGYETFVAFSVCCLFRVIFVPVCPRKRWARRYSGN